MMRPPSAASAVATRRKAAPKTLDPAPKRKAENKVQPDAETLDPITAAALAALGLQHLPRHQRGLDAAVQGIANLEGWGWDQMRAWQYLRAKVPTWNEWRATNPPPAPKAGPAPPPPAPKRKGPPDRPVKRAPAPPPSVSDSP